MISNVHPIEYLLGTGNLVFLCTNLVGVLFIFINQYNGMEIVYFMLTIAMGSFISILIGAAIGISAKNRAGATAISVPFAMLFAFLPMLASFNDIIKRIAQVTYS